MSVDVEIYMNNFQKFFQENPNDLLSLIPKEKENEFFVKVRQIANQNYENKTEVSLTRTQLLNICRELNQKVVDSKKDKNVVVNTSFGQISLN